MPSPSPPSVPVVPEPTSDGENYPKSELPDSIDDTDGDKYFFKLPDAPPGFRPPEGYPSYAEDIDSYFQQGALSL